MNMSNVRFRLLAFIGLVSSVLSSCLLISTHANDNDPVRRKLLSFPPAYYQSVVAVADRILAFSFSSDTKDPSKRVSYAYENDDSLHLFNPQNIENCKDFIGYSIKGLLPDGRIGFLGCGEDTGSILGIFAYDLQTSKVEQLVKGPLVQGYLPKEFTWNPSMTRGIQEMVSGGAKGTLYWISPSGIAPMDIEIEDRELKWNLKDYYEGKDNTGLVRFPAWSPDGKTIGFFASVYGVKEEPELKPDISYELYIMDSEELKPMQVLQNIVDPNHLHWSPNSKNLVFSGCAGLQIKCGLWLFSIKNKSLSLIAKGSFQDFSWVSNEKVVAIKNGTLLYENNEIWEYFISE